MEDRPGLRELTYLEETRKRLDTGTSLLVQELRLYALNARGPSLIPGRGTGSHRLQLETHTAK